MTFVQNIDDSVIINVFAAFTDFIAAGRAECNFFGDRLVTFGAKSH